MVPPQACAGWAETISYHAHPRILLPQNRCLPGPLAAPFLRQPEPRCNTLDFASKVVCQRDASAPLETHADYVRQRLLFINFITCALSTGIVYGHSNNRTWFSTQILRFLWSSSCRFFNPSSPPKKSTAS